MKIISLCPLLFLIFFFGCEDKEIAAQQMYEKAIMLWNSNKKTDSMLTLDNLLIKYSTTSISKKAFQQRQIYLFDYKFDYSPHKEEKEIISIALQNKLNEYFKLNNRYPNNVNELNVDTELLSYFNECSYEKGFSNFGFIINCDNVSNEFMLLNTYSEHIKNDLPIDSFMAYYKTEPDQIYPIDSELVKDINLSNLKDKFYSKNKKISFIDEPKDFKVEYTGYIETSKPTYKNIKIDSGYEKIKIIIDNKIVYLGNGKNQFSYFFDKKLTKIIVNFNYKGIVAKQYNIYCNLQILDEH
jgi:hypothetical protein